MSHAQRAAVAFWAVLAVALAARTLHRPESHTVFPLFASAAAHWWEDRPLYCVYEPLDYFRYPPPFAVAITPLALLGPVAGGVLWSWLSLAVYLWGLRRFLRDVLPVMWSPRRESAFLILSAVGALAGLWNAQSNALMVGLLLLGTSALVGQRWWAAAALLAVPVVLKLTPLPLVLLLCALWPCRLAGRVLLLAAVGFLVPFLTRPPAIVCAQYGGWFDHLVAFSGGRWPGFRDDWTVWLVLRHAATGAGGLPDLRQAVDAAWYPLLQALGGLGVLAGCLWLRQRTSTRELVTATLALGTGWMMLLGPAVEPPTYVFLAPLLAWAVLDAEAWPAGRRLVGTAFVLVMVLGWSALTRPFWNVLPWLAVSLPLGSALFLLWAGGYARARARPRRFGEEWAVISAGPSARAGRRRGTARAPRPA